jgi:stage III sporulation protein AA
MKEKGITYLFPAKIREILEKTGFNLEELYEIRLRVNAPMIVIYGGKEYFVAKDGRLTKNMQNVCMIEAEDLRETMEYVSNYSMYAFEEEIRKGFITIQGGHRVGIAGKTVLDGDKIKSLKYISYINLRLSHQIKGCATPILPYIMKKNNVCHTLIISPPMCGKTTLLRDLIRQVSDGNRYLEGKTVGVVDERSEIAGSYQGIPQNDVGIRTDVLDCCSKAEGMVMLLRSMAPQVIAVDEIGNYEDIRAIEMTLNSGCKLLATVHGSSIDEIRKKPLLERLIKEHVFERYIILQKETAGKIGKVREIYDERGTCLYQRQRSVC